MPLAIEDNSSFGDSTPELVEFETKTGEDFFQIHKEVYIKGVSISKLFFLLAVAAAGRTPQNKSSPIFYPHRSRVPNNP